MIHHQYQRIDRSSKAKIVIDIGINGQIDGQIESIELFSQDFTEKSPRIDGHFDCKIDGKKQMSIYHHKKRNNFIISICQ